MLILKNRPSCVVSPPLPPRCGFCDGLGSTLDCYGMEHACRNCNATGKGTWVPVADFDLDESRTNRKRSVRYDPNARSLRLGRGAKEQWYDVVEFAVAAEYGRGFTLVKADGETYQLQCGPAGVSCSCAGQSYQSSARANQRAHDHGEAIYPTLGCIHLDALVPLVKAGWFDIQREEVADKHS